MQHQKARAILNGRDACQVNAMKFVAIAGVMAFLAGCAVAVPLRLTDTHGGDTTCTANFDRKCFDSSTDGRNARHRVSTAGDRN
jgi:hypothetical protein